MWRAWQSRVVRFASIKMRAFRRSHILYHDAPLCRHLSPGRSQRFHRSSSTHRRLTINWSTSHSSNGQLVNSTLHQRLCFDSINSPTNQCTTWSTNRLVLTTCWSVDFWDQRHNINIRRRRLLSTFYVDRQQRYPERSFGLCRLTFVPPITSTIFCELQRLYCCDYLLLYSCPVVVAWSCRSIFDECFCVSFSIFYCVIAFVIAFALRLRLHLIDPFVLD